MHGGAGRTRLVERDDPRPTVRQVDGPARVAAAELQHVEPAHVTHDRQVRFRDLPHAPGRGIEPRCVRGLVVVGVGVPELAVSALVIGDAGPVHWSGSTRNAIAQ